MMRSCHVLTGFVLAGTLVFGCTPSVTIDAPDIEVTQPNLQFPAAPANVTPGTSVTGSYKISTAKLGATGNPDSGVLNKIERLQVTRLLLRVNAGIEDFAFLDHLTVQATNPVLTTQSGPPPVIEIVDYEVPHDVEVGAVLQLPLSPPVDMLPLWGRTSLYLTVTATGDLPKVDWSMDVVFSLSLRMNQ